MTLATVRRYDPENFPNVGDRAVVVGGSMAGLLTARILADGFEAVTIIERDQLPEEPTTRRGVPQGRHIHAMLKAGRATLDDLFPGYSEELLSAGGLQIDMLSDVVHYQHGGFVADGPTRLPTYYATRPLFEQIVRRRVTDLDGADLRSGCQCTDYLVDDESNVEGVLIRNEDAEQIELTADLVVDATGRTSKTPSWLEDHGYPVPEVDEVQIDMAYSTVVLKRPADDRRAFFVSADPPRTRGAGVFPVEDGRWLTTFFGMHGDHPSTEPEELRTFAGSLPGLDLKQLLDSQPWVSDEIAHYPFPSNRRHRYEDLDRFPDGLVVIGDAITSFNPIYGQGMSVAALEALHLHHALRTDGREDLALRFFDRAEETVNVAWNMAAGADFAFQQTEGPKPRGTDSLNRYVARLTRKAHTDGELRELFYRVFNMEYPPSALLRPWVMWRVLRPTWLDFGLMSSPVPKESPTKYPIGETKEMNQ